MTTVWVAGWRARLTASSRAGRIDADKMTRTVDFIAGAYAVEKRPPAGDLYPNHLPPP